MNEDNKYIEKLKQENEDLKYRLNSLEKIVADLREEPVNTSIEKLFTHESSELSGKDQVYRMLIENMSEGAVVVNSRLMIVYSNKLFAGFTQYPLEKVIGADFSDLLNEEDIQKLKQCVLESKIQKSFCEINLKKNESETSTYLLAVTSFLMRDEYYYIIIPTNINLHKKEKEGLIYKLEEYTAKLSNANKRLNEKNRKLNEINQYLDNFVHSIAHDLRAPVSNIKMIEELFNMAPEKDKPRLLQSLFGNVKRLDDTLYGLVEIIEARGRLEKKAEALNIQQIIEDVLKEKENEITAQQATIKIRRKTALKIYYVREYLYSIIRNLVSNALKYASNERPLQLNITLTRNNGYYVMNFRDNGIGINLKKHGKKLFTPFSRFSSQNDGLGIGLHIIQTTVQKNGGNVDVKSRLGEGTTFKIFLKEIFNT